eukprot:gnl/MRDRNA2_/MRDRNA2_76920_c0_seq1.p1 gnl/MRDRNA2_/MRDRNA2_76920_c0~~gnl/MRDRNA2_/MRDRNA2_76920_c0_seq1.p1  ORF type:complete len:469 (-),score=78.61 gnl/MRDRNA2_/MRDRNA2_76920_c0_seq1:98-1504(-)
MPFQIFPDKIDTDWIWKCEADSMYKWTALDPYGEDAFRNSRRKSSAKRPPDKAKVLLQKIQKKLDPLSASSSFAPELNDDDVEAALVGVYCTLHKDAVIRKKCSERRCMKFDKNEYSRYMTPFKTRIWYWLRPVFIFSGFFALQSLLLHIATHYYVMYMLDVTALMEASNSTHHDLTVMPESMVRNGQLYDAVGHSLGDTQDVELKLLDASGAIPAMLCFGSYVITTWMGDCHIGLWCKTFIIASFMAVTKGVFDLVTILPDSSGWENCKNRLGPDGIEAFKTMFNFSGDFIAALLNMLVVEVVGWKGGRLRYCADMMVSGHTYFAALFSLSTFKMLKYSTQKKSRRWIRYVVGIILLACLIVEVILVALSKFHYTVDMLASIVLVVILWDSIRIETIASHLSEGYFWRDPKWQRKSIIKAIIGDFSKDSKQQYEVVTSRSRKLLNMSMVRQSMLDDPNDDSDPESDE